MMLHWLNDRDVLLMLLISVTALAVGFIALTAVIMHLLK